MTSEPFAHERSRVARLSFPADEARHAWLKPLLTAYAVIDAGVGEALAQQTANGRTLACHKGCSACCRSHTTIPVYPPELIGLSWYAVEKALSVRPCTAPLASVRSAKIEAPVRARLIEQLRTHTAGAPCPILVDDECRVHPLRPMACRQFNVFDRVCAEGEDAYYTRRADVLTPIKAYADTAFEILLPLMGMHEAAQRRALIESGAVHQSVRVLQEIDWTRVAQRMQAHDARPDPGTGEP